jgi:hypothetical protein
MLDISLDTEKHSSYECLINAVIAASSLATGTVFGFEAGNCRYLHFKQ